MIYSLDLSFNLVKHIASNAMRKNKLIPFVLMMEPIFKCNLACSGCGKIREYADVMDKVLDTGECMDAARQAGAPIVSITGGEPLLHPEIKNIINSLLKEGYFVYLCTNALLLEDFLDEIKPNKRLSIVVHLDGMAETHDFFARKKNVFNTAIRAMKKAKRMNFNVRTNTSIYKNSDTLEIIELFTLLKEIKIDGIMVTPAFSYEVLGEERFLGREEIHRVFKDIYLGLDGSRLYNTPVYWDFLLGKRDLDCVPWANPTFNTKGWKSPCYLITDKHYSSYSKMLKETKWENYGVGRDPRCSNCMAHCGYEASSVLGRKSFRDIYKLVKWSLTGRKL